MISSELERAYVFSTNNLEKILSFLDAKAYNEPCIIRDTYINEELRIRTTSSQIVLTRKTGCKKDGYRMENEDVVSYDVASILSQDSRLSVVKDRYQIGHTSRDYVVTLDIISEPMTIAILEIESTNNETPPTASELFGIDLIECPLSAWNLFRQKIGICGAPSCGKTETAKTLSGLLNTQFRANAFNVLEYATSFIQKYNRRPDTIDQFMFWYSQKTREEDAMSKANVVISDCPPFLAYIYMLFYNKDKMTTQFRIHLSKLYKRVLEDLENYSHIIYLRPQEIAQNNIRFQNRDETNDLANRIHSFLKWHRIPHMVAGREDECKILKSLFFMNEIPTKV